MSNIKIKRPDLIKTAWGDNYYYLNEWNDVFDNIIVNPSPLKDKTLYMSSKTISQDKLREAGYKVSRSADKADYIVISDYKSSLSSYSVDFTKNSVRISSKHKIEEFFELFDSLSIYDKFVFDKDLYKNIYKYEGGQELFNTCKDLFQSDNADNTKMAMEVISNANWTNNELYLIELFNLYYRSKYENGYLSNSIVSNPYKNSISFKGFLNSLEFSYDNLYLSHPNDYRQWCLNDEHHDWVYNKFSEEFKSKLDDLVLQYKIKINKLEYSIDKTI